MVYKYKMPWKFAPSEFQKVVKKSLEIDLPYIERPLAASIKVLQTTGTNASVLVLMGWSEVDQEMCLLLTKRSDEVDHHPGQISFPGGMAEAHDETDTALRETEEEVGISREKVHLIGTLPQLSTLSTGFWITPWVGMLSGSVEKTTLTPNLEEIDGAFWVRMSRFFETGVYQQKIFETKKFKVPNHVFEIERHHIWGATGAMIRNLLDRIEQVMLEYKP